MKNRNKFIVDVTFDTPDGFVSKRFVRNTFQKVTNLLASFDLLAVKIVITYKFNH